MDWWDQALTMEHELYGFLPWPRVERAVFDAQISAGWMHSGYPFMAHDLSVPGVVNVSHMADEGDWGCFTNWVTTTSGCHPPCPVLQRLGAFCERVSYGGSGRSSGTVRFLLRSAI